jgi:hypothetical protein
MQYRRGACDMYRDYLEIKDILYFLFGQYRKWTCGMNWSWYICISIKVSDFGFILYQKPFLFKTVRDGENSIISIRVELERQKYTK